MTEDPAEAVRALMVERFGAIPAPEVDGDNEDDSAGVLDALQPAEADERRAERRVAA